MRGVRYLLLALLLLYVPRLESAVQSSAKPTPAGTQARASQPWYFAKVEDHDHEHMQHAQHTVAAPATPRKWEPMREIDPRTMSAWQETYEVTRFPSQQPTAAQRRGADDLLARSRESAKRHGWFDYANAVKDGFTLLPLDDIHHVNRANALDDVQLDPDRPEFLLFVDTPAGKRLAAFMFLTRGPGDHGSQVGGPLTLWHYHVWASPVCLIERRIVASRPDGNDRCTDGVPVTRSPEMMHVWLVKSAPGGPFSTSMSLTEEMKQELMQSGRP